MNWSSEEFVLSTDPTEGALWKKTVSELMQIPFQQALVPADPGGGGVVNNQPGNGFAFNPGGGDSGFDPAIGFVNAEDAADGNKQIGFFRFTAYTGKQILPIGPGGSNVTAYENYQRTPWRKYDVTCDPESSGVAGSAPTGVQTAAFVTTAC